MSEPVEALAKLEQAVEQGSGYFIDGITHEEIAWIVALASRTEQAERDARSWQEVAEVYKTSTAAYRRDAEVAEARLAEAEKVIERLSNDAGRMMLELAEAEQEIRQLRIDNEHLKSVAKKFRVALDSEQQP